MTVDKCPYWKRCYPNKKPHPAHACVVAYKSCSTYEKRREAPSENPSIT
jgi:hypothetical protein